MPFIVPYWDLFMKKLRKAASAKTETQLGTLQAVLLKSQGKTKSQRDWSKAGVRFKFLHDRPDIVSCKKKTNSKQSCKDQRSIKRD